MKQLVRLLISYIIGTSLLLLPTFGSYSKPISDKIVTSAGNVTVKPLNQLTDANLSPQEPILAYSNPNNTYDWGNCTFFVSSVRPDLPQNLGNAIDWLANAQAQGYATGTVPRVNAVVWFNSGYYGHVALVKAVYPDGTILIKEMNVEGLNIVDERIISSDGLHFIY